MVDGKIVGAIGVSGAASAQDGQVAKAGVEAMAK
jgi:glc operon protein GlcG